MMKDVLGYFTWLYSTWQLLLELAHHLYMNDLVYSVLELQCSLAFVIGALLHFVVIGNKNCLVAFMVMGKRSINFAS